MLKEFLQSTLSGEFFQGSAWLVDRPALLALSFVALVFLFLMPKIWKIICVLAITLALYLFSVTGTPMLRSLGAAAVVLLVLVLCVSLLKFLRAALLLGFWSVAVLVVCIKVFPEVAQAVYQRAETVISADHGKDSLLRRFTAGVLSKTHRRA